MSSDQHNEPVLPVTPTNEGRQPRVNNFGYNLPFDELLVVGIGISISTLLAMASLWGLVPIPWYLKFILIITPSIAGHIWTKAFIEGALPHQQRDTVGKLLSVRLDFESPKWKSFPFIPRIKPFLAMASEPELDDGNLHPILRMRERYKSKAK